MNVFKFIEEYFLDIITESLEKLNFDMIRGTPGLFTQMDLLKAIARYHSMIEGHPYSDMRVTVCGLLGYM